jgi:hypothetical protein
MSLRKLFQIKAQGMKTIVDRFALGLILVGSGILLATCRGLSVASVRLTDFFWQRKV